MKTFLLPIVIVLIAAAVVVVDRLALLNPPACAERGMQAFNKGDMVGAIHDFAQAQKFCETDILARRMLGMAYHNYRWNDEALRQYESVWTLYAQNAALAMRNAGRIYQERGEAEKAFECYKKALAVDPNFVGVLADLAELHLKAGHTVAALRAIDEAIKLEPENPFLKEIRAKIRPSPSEIPATPAEGQR